MSPPLVPMRFMVFMDFENFKKSCFKNKKDHIVDYPRVPNFLLEHISKRFKWENQNPHLLRAYAYTGQYTRSLIDNMEVYTKRYHEAHDEEPVLVFENKDYKTGKPIKIDIPLSEYIEDTKKNKEGQDRLFDRAKNWRFFEFRTPPLRFDRRKGIVQKGVDVLIATDLVSHAFRDNFDVAVVCSGDDDLLESIRAVKELGKKVIVVADWTACGRGMRKHSDAFINVQDFYNRKTREGKVIPCNDYKEYSHKFIPKDTECVQQKVTK